MDATAPVAARSDTLALLLQNFLTTIVRIQSGKEKLPEVEKFRSRMKDSLQNFEREAGIAGYDASSIREGKFAAVAFLDETILSTRDPKADEWRKRPLHTELFTQSVAGDAFFDHIAELERGRDSAHLADVLEVYDLCLLLGFEGRYALSRAEATRIAERLRRRIETIRSLDYKLSPPLALASRAAAPPPAPPLPWRKWALAALGGIVLLFLIYYFSLDFRSSQLQSRIPSMRRPFATTEVARA